MPDDDDNVDGVAGLWFECVHPGASLMSLPRKINQKPIIWNKTSFYCETNQQGFRLIMGPPCEMKGKLWV